MTYCISSDLFVPVLMIHCVQSHHNGFEHVGSGIEQHGCMVSYFVNSTFALLLSVRPDPPVSLNWTLLHISPSGLSYDVMVNWEPPPSADVATGWMRIEYEIQYRERNAMNWNAVSPLYFYVSGHMK